MLARATSFDRDTVALTLTASVVDTWFQIQSLRRRVALAQTISDDAEKILALLQAVGSAGKLWPHPWVTTSVPSGSVVPCSASAGQ